MKHRKKKQKRTCRSERSSIEKKNKVGRIKIIDNWRKKVERYLEQNNGEPNSNFTRHRKEDKFQFIEGRTLILPQK